MNKRLPALVALLLTVLLSFPALAGADDDTGGNAMMVVDCEAWVSLRAAPAWSADTIVRIPKGEIVTDCIACSSSYTYASYNGLYGYIMTRYLKPIAYTTVIPDDIGTALFTESDIRGLGEVILEHTVGVYTLLAARTNAVDPEGHEGEFLRLGCFLNGEPLWGFATHTSSVTELIAVNAFVSGTSSDPYIAIYNADHGLIALSPDGCERYRLSSSDVSLGASNCWATGKNGTLYIAGYYGPDPVAISPDGTVLWQADADDPDIYWPCAIDIRTSGILVHYESECDAGKYLVFFDFSGVKQWISAE